MRKNTAVIVVALVLSAAQAQAKLKLPALIGDHMVLQKGKPNIWGWADPGEAVTVALGHNAQAATAGAGGDWKVSLDLPRSGGPYELTVSTATEAVTVQDVMVGEVWVGSGQSNMEFALKASRDAAAEIPSAQKLSKIRLFTAQHNAAFAPQDDVQGSWKVCSPDTAGDFSAVAYYFGKGLYKSLRVPVGLILSCWSGSAAEAWTPRPVLEKDPAFTQLLEQWDHNEDQVKPWKTGNDFGLFLSDIRFLPKDPQAQPLTVSLGPGTPAGALGQAWYATAKPDCQASVTLEGSGPASQEAAIRFYGVLKGGGWGTLSNNLSTQPVDLSRYEAVEFYAMGRGQYRMNLGQPSIADFDYYSTDPFNAPATWAKMRFEIAALKQGGWGAPQPFTPGAVTSLNFPALAPYWPDVAAACYDGMTAPLTPLSIRGALWYQGESNTARAGQYRRLLSDMIGGWREAWGKTFPFLIIQLPNFMARQDQPSESQWAILREAQLKASQTVPQCGLITTIDLGEADNIHPKDKADVGHRAALAALGMVYHRLTVYSGPSLVSARVRGGEAVLTFQDTGRGLTAQGGEPLRGFALAGNDLRFHWAQAQIRGKTVAVSCAEVPAPHFVRYGWADNPDCNLFNVDGLPAPPFESDLEPAGGKSR